MPAKLTNDEFLLRLSSINKNIKPLCEYKNSYDPMPFECLIDGYKWSTEPKHILNGHRCPVCTGNKIGMPPEYKNSIWASEYKEYFSKYLTEKQMKKYMPNTHEKIEAICPNCGKTKYISPKELLHTGLCCICSDGQSFPNKFIYNVFSQLKLNIQPEFTPLWAFGKRYDEYLVDYNIVVENHGMQHYQECSFTNRTLQEEQLNDALKQKLANEHEIQYIALDCRYSSLEHIKQSVMNSSLPRILCFEENDIDWNEASKYANNSLIEESAQLFIDGFTAKEISSILNIKRDTVVKYLKKATKLGLCNYNGRYEVSKAQSKQVYCIELNMIFSSLIDAARYTNQSPSNISLCAKNKIKTAGGYHWAFISNKG